MSILFNCRTLVKWDVSLAPDLSPVGAIEQYQKILAQNYAAAPNITRQNTYTITGVYCPVPNTNDSATHLQVLAHGSTYTKEYWDRGAWGNLSLANSWVHYARKQNYSTLAIDRLCNGASSHPDPQLDCQLTTSTEVFHTLISSLRSGNASSAIPVPETLTFVGHSAGSIAGTDLVQTYPEDVDTLILTGYPSGPISYTGALKYYAEHNITPPASTPSNQIYRPAYLADPKRFSGLDQGYIASTNASARTIFYASDYDPALPALDFGSRGSSPLGEASYTGALSFPAFRGGVMVLTGNLDYFAWLDKDVVRRTRARFPSARSFEWVYAPNVGHDVNFHRAAPKAYREVYERLKELAPEGKSPTARVLGSEKRMKVSSLPYIPSIMTPGKILPKRQAHIDLPVPYSAMICLDDSAPSFPSASSLSIVHTTMNIVQQQNRTRPLPPQIASSN
ncbi:MAG: hypothetical protein Q9170_006770 [Blastenia crenularia]